ncbi:unnamed protein product, partial [marine sediment metagenome]
MAFYKFTNSNKDCQLLLIFGKVYVNFFVKIR